MTKQQLADTIQRADLVRCTKAEYSEYARRWLQQLAAQWVDEKQDIYAVIALNEVRRLDQVHGFSILDAQGDEE